jgi:replication factor C subunit 3/5
MEDFRTAYTAFTKIKTEKSLALDDIIRDLHKCVMETKFDEQMKMFLVQRLSEIEFRLAQGINEKAQTASVVGAFIEVRTVRK